jgi:hypothetical protein
VTNRNLQLSRRLISLAVGVRNAETRWKSIISFLKAKEGQIQKKTLHLFVVLVMISMGITPIFGRKSVLDGITGTNLVQVVALHVRRVRAQLPLMLKSSFHPDVLQAARWESYTT